MQTPSNIAAVRWKGNKVVNVFSTFVREDLQKAKRFSQKKKHYHTTATHCDCLQQIYGGVDCMNQNISCYMVHLQTKKWRWPLFLFCIDVAANNVFSYIDYANRRLAKVAWMHYALEEPLLKPIVIFIKKIVRLLSFRSQGLLLGIMSEESTPIFGL